MAITTGLVIKALVAAGLLSLASAGIYCGKNYYLDNLISKYDTALMNYMYADVDNDIVFDVKKGGDESQDLTENDLEIPSGDPKNLSISAVVKVSTTGNTHFKKKGNKAAEDNDKGMKRIKELNGGNWTWKCTLTFAKNDNMKDDNLTKIKNKDRIFSSGSKGLLGILKKDLSNYNHDRDRGDKWSKRELKKIKWLFISMCGYQRSFSENKKLNQKTDVEENKVVESNLLTIKFDAKDDDQLTLKNTHTFDTWFKEEYVRRIYETEAK